MVPVLGAQHRGPGRAARTLSAYFWGRRILKVWLWQRPRRECDSGRTRARWAALAKGRLRARGTAVLAHEVPPCPAWKDAEPLAQVSGVCRSRLSGTRASGTGVGHGSVPGNTSVLDAKGSEI